MNPRIPPSNLEAEQLVLGALLRPRFEIYSDVSSILLPEHFADPVHGFIFKEIKDRIEAGYPEDELRIEVEGDRVTHDIDLHLEEVGGSRYLIQIADLHRERPASPALLAHQIRHAYHCRVTTDMAEDIINRGHVLLDLAFDRASTEGAFTNLAAAQEDIREACRLMPGAEERFADAISDQLVAREENPFPFSRGFRDAISDRYGKPGALLDQYGEPMVATVALSMSEVEDLYRDSSYAAKRFRPRKRGDQPKDYARLHAFYTARAAFFERLLPVQDPEMDEEEVSTLADAVRDPSDICDDEGNPIVSADGALIDLGGGKAEWDL